MSKKTKAGLTLGALSLGLVGANVLATPQLAWFLDQDMGTFVQIGQTVGSALAAAFGSSWFELIGVVLFVA
ncbi:MAG: hypothetical protein HYY93_16320 [Planctomycetes bacterium]|nr:hypothetical protein [Planctomycetota bacterium]